MALLGIDIGTSSVKSLVMEEDGRVLGFSQKEYSIDIPAPGYAEQDPELWWDLVCETTGKALLQAGLEGSSIRGVGLSGQMHGLVVLDKQARPLRPAIIWCDQRAVSEMERVTELLTKAELGAMIQNPVATGFQLLSLMWMRENETEIFRQVRYVMTPKDYVRFRLTGAIASDSTDASGTSAFDVSNRVWSLPLLSRVGIDPGLFPAIFEPWNVSGTITREAAVASGLQTGTPVVYGGADQPMQAIGNGILHPGVVSCTLGTGGQLLTPLDRPVFDPELRTHLYTHAVPDRWYMMAATMNAGLSLKWLAGNILRNYDYAQLDEQARGVAAGSEGLLFLPYLTGERTPHMDPHLKGMFFGLTLNHNGSTFVRAVLEGVAYSLRDCLEIFNGLNVHTERIIVSGGGAKSALWRQIIADILGQEIYTSNMKEQACVGAAITAAVGIGLYAGMDQACASIVRISEESVRPDSRNHDVYEEQYMLFRDLYRSNKELFRKELKKK